MPIHARGSSRRDGISRANQIGGSMGSIKSYPHRELSRLRHDWLRRNRWLVLATAGFYASFVGASAAMLSVLGESWWWGYALGLSHAGLAAALLHLLNTAFLAHERTAVFQLRGAWGEDNTRSELQKAKKRRLVWGWVDSITFQSGDIDHVVVTRTGGVVMIDSKFRTDVTAEGVAAMTAGARRAKLRAESLARQLLRADRSGRHRARAHSVSVTPCIVLWGPARKDVPDGHTIDGVHFVDGRKLLPWLAQLPPAAVSADAGTDLLERLTEFRSAANAQR